VRCGLLWLTTSVVLGGCSNAPSVVPAGPSCPEAEAQLTVACCPGGPDHGAGPGLTSQSVTYQDCDTGELVSVECSPSSALPGEQTQEGPQTGAGPMSAACQDALQAAQDICPGFDITQEAGAVQCPAPEVGLVLPACEPLQAMADRPNRCSLLGTRDWQPISVEQAGAIRAQLRTDPNEVTLSAPPEDHEAGVPPPDVTGQERDPNRILPSLRLEVPGNFLRYQLTEGPLRASFAKADELDGFNCDADALRCLINPLALVDLSEALPMQNGLSADFNPVTIDGQAAWRLENLTYTGALIATWQGHVDVKAEPMVVDMGDSRTRLSWLPLHVPNDRRGMNASNSYSLTPIQFPDRQRNMLDQALIVTHLDEATCWAFSQSPSYLTFSQPVQCVCTSGSDQRGYCITELSPREHPKTPLLNYAVNTEHAFLVLCNDPLLIKPLPYRDLFAAAQAGNDPDLTNMKVTSTFTNYFSGQGGAEFTPPVDEARLLAESFGCSGRLSKYARVGEQREDDFGGLTTTVGEGTSSAAGLELVTEVNLGGVDVEISSGRVQFTFPVLASFEEWVKKKFGSVLGWFLKWVVRIISGTINVTASFDLPPTGLPNAATVRLGIMDVGVQTLLSEIQASGGTQQGLALGVRRISTSKPTVDDTAWKLDVRWDAPSCDALTSDKSNVLEKFKALIGCPLELIANTAAELLSPVTTFLGKELLEAFLFLTNELNAVVFDEVVGTVQSMEEGNIIAQFIQDAGSHVLFEPYYLQTLGDRERAAVGALPPVLATACAAAPNPGMACTLMHLMMGNGLLEVSGGAQIMRVGAKTHYRSMQDFEGLTPSYCFPPVRYCVVGDDPPQSPAFDADARASSQDLSEIDVAEVGGLDWRHQCALFVDLSARASGIIRTPDASFEVTVRPSWRTQTLLNEIFTCRNSAYCHPTASPNHLAQRAELAACSLLGDIWGHPAGTTEAYTNELVVLTSVTDPVGLAALQAVWDAYIDEAGLRTEANAFVALLDFADGCIGKLEAAGYPAPPPTLAAEVLELEAPYECEARFLP